MPASLRAYARQTCPPRVRSRRRVAHWSSVRFAGRFSSAQRAPLNRLAASWSGRARNSFHAARRTTSKAAVTSSVSPLI